MMTTIRLNERQRALVWEFIVQNEMQYRANLKTPSISEAPLTSAETLEALHNLAAQLWGSEMDDDVRPLQELALEYRGRMEGKA